MLDAMQGEYVVVDIVVVYMLIVDMILLLIVPERIAPERTPAFVAARTLNKTIAAVDCQGMMVESAGAGHA